MVISMDILKSVIHILKKNTTLDDTILLTIDENDDLTKYGYNSIDFIKVIVELEKEFGIELDDSDLLLDKFNTLSKIRDTILKNNKEKESLF